MQDAASGAVTTSLPIVVRLRPLDEPGGESIAEATAAAATNKLLRTARFDLARPGRWHAEVLVAGLSSQPPIGFDVRVGPAAPAWLELTAWIAWPAAVIVLFIVHQLLVHRRGRPASAAPV